MVNIYKLQFSILQQEILKYLFIKAGMSFNARGLARPLGRTQAGIVKALPELEKAGLIKTHHDKKSGRWSIEMNRENRKTIAFKRVENLRMIYESDIAGFLEDNFPGTNLSPIDWLNYPERQSLLARKRDRSFHLELC